MFPKSTLWVRPKCPAIVGSSEASRILSESGAVPTAAAGKESSD